MPRTGILVDTGMMVETRADVRPSPAARLEPPTQATFFYPPTTTESPLRDTTKVLLNLSGLSPCHRCMLCGLVDAQLGHSTPRPSLLSAFDGRVTLVLNSLSL